MNKLKKLFTIFSLLIFIVLLFKYNYLLNKSVIDAVNLWLSRIFPSLFIMFVLNDIIIETDALRFLNIFLSPFFNKLFNTSGNSFQVFLLSLISGTPTSAFIIKEMLNNNSITTNDANKLISFTYFSNPLFLYNILSLSFNKSITIKLIIIHYITNILIGIIYRKNNDNIKVKMTLKNKDSKNIFMVLPSSITKSINTLLMILGTITFYMILTNLLLSLFNFNYLSSTIFKGILEITQSLNDLPFLDISLIKKELLAIAIISFGGLSIHTQIISLINDTEIKYQNFLMGRILHVFLSTTITYLCSFISLII